MCSPTNSPKATLAVEWLHTYGACTAPPALVLGTMPYLSSLMRVSVYYTIRMPLSFEHVRHLRNPANGNKDVKVGRDGQEVDPAVGVKLVALFHQPGAGLPLTPDANARVHMRDHQERPIVERVTHFSSFPVLPHMHYRRATLCRLRPWLPRSPPRRQSSSPTQT